MHCMGVWRSFLSIGSVYYLAMFKPCRKDSCQIPLPNPTQWSLEMFLGRYSTISTAALRTVTAYRSLGLPGSFLHTGRSSWMSNYRHAWKPRMQLAFSRYSVTTRIFMHTSTVNYLLCGARFFRKLHTEAM